MFCGVGDQLTLRLEDKNLSLTHPPTLTLLPPLWEDKFLVLKVSFKKKVLPAYLDTNLNTSRAQAAGNEERKTT